MTHEQPKTSASPIHAVQACLLGCCLVAVGGIGRADGGIAVGEAPTGQAALTVDQAMQAMAGMGGVYRVDQQGDTYLYPLIKLKQDLNGMHGIYRITPDGITLVPTGMDVSDVTMQSLGGISGSFRVTPSGEAYFQPKPQAPIGMSGETGRERHRGVGAP